jgi:hypothetical protein
MTVHEKGGSGAPAGSASFKVKVTVSDNQTNRAP